MLSRLFAWIQSRQEQRRRIRELEAKIIDLQYDVEEADESRMYWYRRYVDATQRKKAAHGPCRDSFIGDRFSSIQ